jgi:GAF domain-containing protein
MTQANLQNPPQEKTQSAIAQIWGYITSANPGIKDTGERRRAQTTAALTFILFVATILGAITGVNKTGLVVVAIVGLISYILSRTRYYEAGAFLFIIGLSASPYINILTGNTDSPVLSVFSFIPLSLILASALVNKWAVFFLTGINVAAIFYSMPNDPKAGVTIGIVSATGILLTILDAVREGIEKSRLEELRQANQELRNIQSNLEERVTERTTELKRRSTQMEAASFVARAAAEVRDLKSLLDNVVSQITERFDFYHAGIFLVEPNEQFVILQAASSGGGKKMIERGHRLEIGRQGIVGYAAYQRRPRIAQDVGADAVYFNNPDLPQTHSEIALPLVTQNRLIGILDIQSQERNAFTNEDVYTLQAMADQIALAIDNAKLIDESQAAVQQLQTLMGQKTMLSWKNWLGQQNKGFVYTPLGVSPLPSAAEEKIKPAAERPGGERTVQVAINLRGKQIGAISLRRKSAEAPWTEAEQDMADKIASQVALAVENARLLEESQRRALREQRVNDLSSRFSRSLDVDILLQNAVRELHRIPQVSEVSIFIAPSETTGKAEQEA